MDQSRSKLAVYSVLVIILLLSLLLIVSGLRGKIFVAEAAGVIVLVVLCFAGFLGYAARWGERVFFFLFLVYIINLSLLWYVAGKVYVVPLIIALLGFLMSVPQPAFRSRQESSSEPHSKVFEPEQSLAEKKQSVDVSRESKVQFTPGKYVASKMGNTYHLPRCDWAKKIVQSRRVWFATSEEAKEKSYKPHSCVSQ